MAVISGRYGSVQRLLPTLIDPVTGAYTWQTVDPAALADFGAFTEKAGPNITDDPGSSGTAHEGDPTTVSSITSWSLENTVQPISYIASNTRGYQGKLEGLHSCTGQIAGLGGCPPIAPGQRFKFLGYVGPTSGKLDDKVGHVYQIAAIANSVQVQINYQMSNPITWTVGWQSDWKQSGDELMHNPSGIAGFWDYTKPPCSTLMPSRTRALSIGDVVSADELCLVDANIQFSTEVANFANSCSAVAGGWQTCTVGATNCTLNANIHGNHYGIISSTHLPGTDHNVRLYVEGGALQAGETCESKAYWEFEKMFFGSFGGLNVDVTTNNPVQFSCAMEFNAYPGCNPGYIKYNPGGTGDAVFFVDLRPDSEKSE